MGAGSRTRYNLGGEMHNTDIPLTPGELHTLCVIFNRCWKNIVGLPEGPAREEFALMMGFACEALTEEMERSGYHDREALELLEPEAVKKHMM